MTFQDNASRPRRGLLLLSRRGVGRRSCVFQYTILTIERFQVFKGYRKRKKNDWKCLIRFYFARWSFSAQTDWNEFSTNWSAMFDENEDVLSTLRKISENSKHLLEVGGPIGALVVAGIKEVSRAVGSGSAIHEIGNPDHLPCLSLSKHLLSAEESWRASHNSTAWEDGATSNRYFWSNWTHLPYLWMTQF